jgi:hypothetical protein
MHSSEYTPDPDEDPTDEIDPSETSVCHPCGVSESNESRCMYRRE